MARGRSTSLSSPMVLVCPLDPAIHPAQAQPRLTTRWSSRVSFVRILERYVTKFAPHTALKLIAEGKLTFDERFVIQRVEGSSTVRSVSSRGVGGSGHGYNSLLMPAGGSA